MAKRVMDRRALRAQAEAAERLETGQTGEEAQLTTEVPEGEAPAKKSRAKTGAAKPKRTKARATKIPARMRIVWTVFNNSNQPVAKYDYPQRAEADAHAARLTTEKRVTHFVMPVKEAMEIPE
jgi:hypothetical protein